MEIVMLVVFIILVYVVLKTVADYRYNKLLKLPTPMWCVEP